MIINAAFVSQHGEAKEMDRAERLNKRNEVARRLLTNEYKDAISELERRAKETHEQQVKEWKVELDEIEEAEDVHL